MASGAVAGSAIAGTGKSGRHAVEGTSLPSIIAIGVSNDRLFVYGMGRITGHPNKVLHVIPLEQVMGVRSEQGRAVGFKILKFDIVFGDGSSLQLDVPTEHMKSGREVVEALVSRTAALPMTEEEGSRG